jgi:hypothetical protein
VGKVSICMGLTERIAFQPISHQSESIFCSLDETCVISRTKRNMLISVVGLPANTRHNSKNLHLFIYLFIYCVGIYFPYCNINEHGIFSTTCSGAYRDWAFLLKLKSGRIKLFFFSSSNFPTTHNFICYSHILFLFSEPQNQT